jgi:hypothetical protein
MDGFGRLGRKGGDGADGQRQGEDIGFHQNDYQQKPSDDQGRRMTPEVCFAG